MIEFITDYLVTLGIAGLLLGVFIEATGLPFPGGIMIVLAAVLCHQGKLNPYYTGAAALVGFILGSLSAYLVARKMGWTFLQRYTGFLHITPEVLQKARTWLDRSAAIFLIFGRFIPGIGNLTPYLAGLSNISTGWFVFYNLIFVMLWGVIFLTVGSIFDQKWSHVFDFLRTRSSLVALAALAAGFLFIYFRKFLVRSRYE